MVGRHTRVQAHSKSPFPADRDGGIGPLLSRCDPQGHPGRASRGSVWLWLRSQPTPEFEGRDPAGQEGDGHREAGHRVTYGGDNQRRFTAIRSWNDRQFLTDEAWRSASKRDRDRADRLSAGGCEPEGFRGGLGRASATVIGRRADHDRGTLRVPSDKGVIAPLRDRCRALPDCERRSNNRKRAREVTDDRTGQSGAWSRPCRAGKWLRRRPGRGSAGRRFADATTTEPIARLIHHPADEVRRVPRHEQRPDNVVEAVPCGLEPLREGRIGATSCDAVDDVLRHMLRITGQAAEQRDHLQIVARRDTPARMPATRGAVAKAVGQFTAEEGDVQHGRVRTSATRASSPIHRRPPGVPSPVRRSGWRSGTI